MQKRASNGYFNFTRKERNGTIFLLIVILLLTAMPYIYPLVFKEEKLSTADLQNDLAVLKMKQSNEERASYRKYSKEDNYQNDYEGAKKNYSGPSIKAELFYFDPNTLSAEGWKKLGIREKTITTIQNFIAKGGKFRNREDIKKIWGLHEDEVLRLLPFVRIEPPALSAETVKPFPSSNKYEKKRNFGIIDINLADTNALISLPGIGSKLANRIISFREKLGGFYSIGQVSETFGLADSVFQKIRPFLELKHEELKKININTASLDELKQHPYIRYNIANAIIQYRTQHGNFAAIPGIKKIMLVNEGLYNKLSPYLVTE